VLTINADVLQIINMIIQVKAVNILRVPGIPTVKHTIIIVIVIMERVIAIVAIMQIILMDKNALILILMTTHGFGFWSGLSFL
jgi:hypothetical protein